MVRRLLQLCAALALLAPGTVRACDLALLLAVDVSSSIAPEEYFLQMEGLAVALTDPEIAEALVAGQVALTLVQWSGEGRQAVSLPWRQIRTPADLAAFADAIGTAPRVWDKYSTAIGEALRYSVARFADAPDCLRRVIDISGDGLSNEGVGPEATRLDADRLGITVNGLAIESNVTGLANYYRAKVMIGQGAFVVTADSFEDYPRAIRHKLLREIIKPAF